jgi:hydroxymethylpyrimidine/phosphomethylpyrimidine kinase
MRCWIQIAAATLRELLFPLADLITPNIPEAEVLTGRALKTANDFEQAARQLHRWVPEPFVERRASTETSSRKRFGSDEVVDLLFDGRDSTPSVGPGSTLHTHTALAARSPSSIALDSR